MRVIPPKKATSFQIKLKGLPFNIMSFKMTIKYLAGTIYEIPWSNLGILSMGKTNPESSMVGIIRAMSDTIMAICWLFVMEEMNIPNARQVMMNNKLNNNSNARLPITGTPKMKTPIARINNPIIMESKM